MEAKQIAQLRAYEKMILNHIIEDYGSFLSEEKRRLLSEKTLIPDDYENTFTSRPNLQGEILRLVFRKVFEHIECKKTIDFSDGSKPSIPYGNYLKEGLVLYYCEEFSKKYNLEIDKLPNSEENLEMVINLKEKLDANFGPLVFNCDCISLLNAANIEELTKKCDSDAVKKYIESLNKNLTDKEMIDKIPGKRRVYPPIYTNGLQYIKYVDEKDEVHMIKSTNPKIVSDAYKEMLKNTPDNGEMDIDKFFKELKNHGETILLFKDSEYNKSRLSKEESNMLNTLYSDGKVQDKADTKPITHSTDMNVHVIESTNDVIISNTALDKDITHRTFEDKNSTPHDKPENSEEIELITAEEYEKICNKFINPLFGAPTEEEQKKLDYYDRYYFGEPQNAVAQVQAQAQVQQDISDKQLTEQPIQMKLTQSKPKNSGFAQKYLPVIIVFITIFIGIIVGIALFKIRA